jgi:hypothetical protein
MCFLDARQEYGMGAMVCPLVLVRKKVHHKFKQKDTNGLAWSGMVDDAQFRIMGGRRMVQRE